MSINTKQLTDNEIAMSAALFEIGLRDAGYANAEMALTDFSADEKRIIAEILNKHDYAGDVDRLLEPTEEGK